MLAPFALATCALLLSPQEPPPPAPSAPAAQQPAAAPIRAARVAWQRSLDDALALQKSTGLPLLIAVNMDGEVFNDRFASTTYRDPAFVASTRGYICVVASPDRHSERDYDALGNRIECPRFGGCTCSEHINIEPELFRRFFSGKRNAPRHVGVDLAGEILFDRFLDRSMQTAVDAIAKNHGDGEAAHLQPTDDLEEMFRRRDAMARRLLELRYRRADEAGRTALLKRAATADNDPVDLLRMGLHDPSPKLCGLAALALSKVGGSNALIDIEDALARIDDQGIREALIAQLRELGKHDPAAARMASNFERAVDQLAEPWRKPWRDSPLSRGREGVEAELDEVEAALRDRPDDPVLRLRLATAQTAFAMVQMVEGGSDIGLWLADADRNAGRVADEALQPEAKAVLTIARWYQSDGKGALQAAVEAQSMVRCDREPDAWLAANFLDVLLQLTAQSAYGRAQLDENASLRGELGRTRAVFELLHARNAGDERGALAGIGLLEYAGLRREAQTQLEWLVQRFPGSIAVHDRWRNRLLVDYGAERMRHRLAKFANEATDRPTAQWFAGYAALIAAERHTSDDRKVEADNAYTDAIERFLDSAAGNEDYADTANHYAVLALAGRAWIRSQKGRAEDAVQDLLRAAELRPASLDEDDGLQRKPRGIVGRVHAALVAAGRAELAAQLEPLLP